MLFYQDLKIEAKTLINLKIIIISFIDFDPVFVFGFLAPIKSPSEITYLSGDQC